MNNLIRIAVIVGTTRPGRASTAVADWYMNAIKDVPGIETERIEVADLSLPLFDEPQSPSTGVYQNQHSKKWSERIAPFDAYVWVTAEYNHSVPASLKNAIDYLYHEWVRKPVALVSYGAMGGVRAAEHLRQIASELQMMAIRPTVMIRDPWAMLGENNEIKPELISGDPVKQMEDLLWWAQALKAARA